MTVKNVAAFTAFFVFIGGFLWYVHSLGIRVSPPANRTELVVNVTDVNSIVVDSNVLLRGVPVGKVSAIDTDPQHATIRFYVKDGVRVPTDTVVKLENLSALGESYVELEPKTGDGPWLRGGETVPAAMVRQPASISELGGTVVRVLNQLDPGQLKRVVGEADAALPDPYTVLPNLERASQLLQNTTADLNGRGGQALDNAQSLLENAQFVGPALADATPAARAIGPNIRSLWDPGSENVLRNDAPGSIYIFGKFIQRLQKLLDDRGADIRVLTEPLTANVNAIAASMKTIDSSRILANLLAAVPEDGAITLHVSGAGATPPMPPLPVEAAPNGDPGPPQPGVPGALQAPAPPFSDNASAQQPKPAATDRPPQQEGSTP